MKHIIGRSGAIGIAFALAAVFIGPAPGLKPASAQPAPKMMVAPAGGGTGAGVLPGQFGIWEFLDAEQNKAAVALPNHQADVFVPSICAGAYPPPGCQSSVTKFEPGQKNWFDNSTGG